MKPARSNHFALTAAAAFLGLIGLCVLAGKMPVLVLGLYLVASAIAFAAYAIDKAAARRQQWRISERTLHLFSLAGGWPGALLAQGMLRHKTKKAAFQVRFWSTVLIHCSILAWLLSPFGWPAIRAMLWHQ